MIENKHSSAIFTSGDQSVNNNGGHTARGVANLRGLPSFWDFIAQLLIDLTRILYCLDKQRAQCWIISVQSVFSH